jgi:hypothetical protein
MLAWLRRHFTVTTIAQYVSWARAPLSRSRKIAAKAAPFDGPLPQHDSAAS